MTRYSKQQNIVNASAYYRSVLESKKLPVIRHKNIYNFEILNRNIHTESLSSINYIWKNSDKLYNISEKFYKNPTYGWIILYTNGISSEMELKENSVIRIYFPFEKLIKDI